MTQQAKFRCIAQADSEMAIAPESRGCGHEWTADAYPEPIMCPACQSHLSIIEQVQAEQTPGARILAAMAALNLTVESEFVPFSQSRNAKPRDDGKPWLSLNWRVTIKRDGRDVLTTDYSSGSGHAPASRASAGALNLVRSGRSDKVAREKLVEFECEHGWPARYMIGESPNRIPKADPILPEPEAVVWSLVQDSDVLNAGGFEEWASDLGYDADSRKAEATYRACLEIALKLRAAIGDAGLEALRTAGQDY